MAKRRRFYSMRRYAPRMPNVSGIIKRAVSAGRRAGRRARNYRPKNKTWLWLLGAAVIGVAVWQWDKLKAMFSKPA